VNTAVATGWLLGDGETAWTPGAEPRRKLIFEAMLQADGDPEPTPWRCEIEDPAQIAKAEPLLTAGRGVAIRAQLAGRPFVDHGVKKGFVRFLRVDHVEFVKADRAKPPAEPAEAESNFKSQ
jgi:hypothetical protein